MAYVKSISGINDQIYRDRIVSDLDSNFFVDAGAGSGKTTSIVLRMIALVKNKDLDASKKICAITYTKAAADEFYSRYQAGLLEEITKEKDPLIKAKLENAYNNIDSCFMGTIDAFCKKILDEHPKEADVPSSSTIAPDELINNIINKVYEAEAIKNSPEFQNYSKYCLVDKRRLFAVIVKDLISKRDYTINYKNYPDDFDTYFATHLLEIKNTFAEIEFQHAVMAESKTDYFHLDLQYLDQPVSANFKKVRDLINKIGHIKIEKNALLSTPYLKNGKGCRKLDFDSLVTIMDDYAFNKCVEYCNTITDKVIELLKENGYFTFFDNLYYLKNLLKKDISNGGKIIKQVQKEYNYFFLDEFQDTDPMQVEIFFYLTTTNFKNKWDDNIPKSGSLFIVGDPKQSIYRFKGADIKSYSYVEDLFAKNIFGEVLYLTDNKRSTDSLKKYFNKMFDRGSFPTNPYNLSNFYFTIPTTNESYSYVTGAFKYRLNSNSYSDIIPLIQSIVNNPDILIEGKRMVCYDDIMIITNTKNQILNLSKELKKYDIPHFCYGSIDFASSEILQFLKDVFAYIDIPNNTNKVALASNNIFNFTDEDIFNILYDHNVNNPLFNKIMDICNSVTDSTKPHVASSIINNIINDQDFINIISNNVLSSFYKAYELLLDYETQNAIYSIKLVLNFIDDLLSGKSGAERELLFDINNSGIEVANLHKVKGLQRPVVITVSLHDRKNAENFFAQRNPNIYTPLIYGFKEGVYQYSIKTDNETISALADKEKSDELDRQRYVAATRAKQILIITYETKKDGVKEDMFAPLLDSDMEDISTLFTNNVSSSSNSPISSNFKTISFNKNTESRFVKPSRAHSLSHGDTDNEDRVDLRATSIGTMIHRLMEVLVLSSGKADIDKLCEQISKDNINTIDYKYNLKSVAETMLNGGYPQKGNVPQDILKEILTSDKYFTEVPFAFKENNKIYQGIMDAVYVKDDIYHVIDYKTDISEDNLDIKHKDQLDIYVKALKLQGIDNIDAHIYRIEKEDK